MMKPLKVSLCGAVLGAVAPPALAADKGLDLTGVWESLACELRPQAGQDGVAPWFLKRSITFGPGRIDAHFTTFADPACAAPLLELKFGGEVTVLGASDVAEGAWEVDLLVNDYLTVTPRMEGFAAFLNSADSGACGADAWVVGAEQGIFVTGCSVMGVAANAPTTEYEVLHISAGHLYFGARPVDGRPLADPADRPTALHMPLRRRSGGATQKVGAEVRAFFKAITEKMNQNDTLLYRTVGQGEDGAWLRVNYWTSRPDMETLNAQAQSWAREFSEMAHVVKPSSFRLTSYATGL